MRALAAIVVATAVVTAPLTAPAQGEPPAPSQTVVSPPGGIPDPIRLGITGLSDVVVDEAHGHVYFSDGFQKVQVTDLEGSFVADIEGLTGVEELVLSQDQSTVFVPLPGSHEVVGIDTTTLAVSRWSTGDDCPIDVAEASGLLWVGVACDDGVTGSIGAMDMTNHTYTPDVYAHPDTALNVPRLVSSPQAPDRLLLLERGSTPADIVMLQTSAAAGITELARIERASFLDAAFLADGSRLVLVQQGGSQDVLMVDSLAPDGSYDTSFYTWYVAVRGDGAMAFGSNQGMVHVFPPGSRTKLRTYTFPSTYGLADQGVAFGETNLYVVSEGNSNTHYLRILPPRAASTLKMTGENGTREFNEQVSVAVRLTTGAASQREVSVYTNEPGGEPRLIGTGVVPDGDAFVATTRVQRNTRFSATYAGDDESDAASLSSTRTMRVHAKIKPKALGYRSRKGNHYTWSVHKTAYVYGRVRPDQEKGCETFQVQWKVKGRWGNSSKTKCVKLSSTSWAGVYITGDKRLLPYPFRIRGLFEQSKTNLGTTGPWTYGRFVRSGSGRAVVRSAPGPATAVPAPALPPR